MISAVLLVVVRRSIDGARARVHHSQRVANSRIDRCARDRAHLYCFEPACSASAWFSRLRSSEYSTRPSVRYGRLMIVSRRVRYSASLRVRDSLGRRIVRDAAASEL